MTLKHLLICLDYMERAIRPYNAIIHNRLYFFKYIISDINGI